MTVELYFMKIFCIFALVKNNGYECDNIRKSKHEQSGL